MPILSFLNEKNVKSEVPVNAKNNNSLFKFKVPKSFAFSQINFIDMVN